jgi:hypothetical protein
MVFAWSEMQGKMDARVMGNVWKVKTPDWEFRFDLGGSMYAGWYMSDIFFLTMCCFHIQFIKS